jgi:hypothetical protein
MRMLITALLITVANPVVAQPAPVANVAEPDAARLAAATRMVEVVMPPALREQMIEQTASAMVANMGNAVMGSSRMAAAFEKEPRARPIFERYMAKVADDTRTMMRDMMPDMINVMKRYYARQLTVQQLNEVHDFYATPAGQKFALVAAGVMTDPEYGRLMQTTMAKVMERAPEQAKALNDELKALGPAPASK